MLFGIEHEVAVVREDGAFADASNTTTEELLKVVAALPYFPEDKQRLYVDTTKYKDKRWILEGKRRFSADGQPNGFIPKGFEIRTPPHSSITEATQHIGELYVAFTIEAKKHGFTPVLTSYNPVRSEVIVDNPFNEFEKTRQLWRPLENAVRVVGSTYGPDLNLSDPGLSEEQLIDIAQKLTYYSPFIVPFSFSSPFYEGKKSNCYSARTYLRAVGRPSSVVYISSPSHIPVGHDPLAFIEKPHLPEEAGRIEFKAFDTPLSLQMYTALFALLKGIVLDTNLPGRARVPDVSMHQKAAKEAFDNTEIYDQASRVLEACRNALGSDPDAGYLEPLAQMLAQRRTPAHHILEVYSQQDLSITQTLLQFTSLGAL